MHGLWCVYKTCTHELSEFSDIGHMIIKVDSKDSKGEQPDLEEPCTVFRELKNFLA